MNGGRVGAKAPGARRSGWMRGAMAPGARVKEDDHVAVD